MGPVVGPVTSRKARVLFEVDCAATVTVLVAEVEPSVDEPGREADASDGPVPAVDEGDGLALGDDIGARAQVAIVAAPARRPCVVEVEGLRPGRSYAVRIAGVSRSDAAWKRAWIRTPPLEQARKRIAVLGSARPGDAASTGTATDVDALAAAVDVGAIDMVVHVGCAVRRGQGCGGG